MTAPAHSVRNGLADKERSFTLDEDALCWTDAGGGKGRMPNADVRDMRLIAYTSPIGETFQCTLRGTSGKVKLRSAHYASLNNFENRTATYAPFVRALAGKIAAAAPDAKFIAGSTGLWIAAIVVCAIAVPWMWRRITQGGAKHFDPKAPPPALLGQA